MKVNSLIGIVLGLFLFTQALAQAVRSTPVVPVQRQFQPTTGAGATTQTSSVDTTDAFTAQVWGLNADEVQRAKALLRGPRASFSIPNLSPIEALGIHARSDAERRKYAELFARAQHADTERVLAWMYAYQEAMQRLYPNERVIDFGGLPKANVDIGTADAANVPRAAVQQPRRAGSQ